MSNLDLNNAVDFARATVSPAATVLAELSGTKPEEWDISEATFISNQRLAKNPKAAPLKFLTFTSADGYRAGLANISDQGGRAKVKFRFPYRDGQTTDDMGRLPEGFALNVLIYGQRYKQGLKAFLEEFNQPSPGILRHPVRGEITCGLESYELLHSHDQRQAVAIRVHLIEHTFTIDLLDQQAPTTNASIKSALLKALDAVAKVDSVLARVQQVILKNRTIARRVEAALTQYKKDFTLSLQRMNVSFNNGSSADLPGLLPVNDGGLLTSSGATQGDTFTTLLSPNDPFRPVELQDASLPALATQQAVDDVNARRAQVQLIIADLNASLDGQGSLEFHDEVLDLKRTAITLQEVLEAGIASNQLQVTEYTVPRLMSIREAAFMVGIGPNRAYEIEVLNPSLLSVNHIETGTVLKVPTR